MCVEKCCFHCDWWVAESEKTGEFSHKEAIKQKKGFCLVRDLFTYTDREFFCKNFSDDTKPVVISFD